MGGVVVVVLNLVTIQQSAWGQLAVKWCAWGHSISIMQQSQSQADALIYRMRRGSEGWKEIAEQVNRQFKLYYSINDIIYRYEIMTAKLDRQQVIQLFSEFQRYQTHFQLIADATSIPLNQVKKEIISGLVNNIWKVCFIVRKRKISSLKSNFLDNEQMKQLVVLMLKQSAFANIKEEYSYLWSFISKYYPDDYYHTVSDEMYKIVYRQLIILVEKFKLSPNRDKEQLETTSSFERSILIQAATASSTQAGSSSSVGSSTQASSSLEGVSGAQSGGCAQDYIQSILEMAKSKKKVNKQTIDLVSDEERSEHEESGLSITEEDLAQNWHNNMLRESIRLHLQMETLEQLLSDDPLNQQLRRQRLEKAVAIGCLQIMQTRRDCL